MAKSIHGPSVSNTHGTASTTLRPEVGFDPVPTYPPLSLSPGEDLGKHALSDTANECPPPHFATAHVSSRGGAANAFARSVEPATGPSTGRISSQRGKVATITGLPCDYCPSTRAAEDIAKNYSNLVCSRAARASGSRTTVPLDEISSRSAGPAPMPSDVFPIFPQEWHERPRRQDKTIHIAKAYTEHLIHHREGSEAPLSPHVSAVKIGSVYAQQLLTRQLEALQRTWKAATGYTSELYQMASSAAPPMSLSAQQMIVRNTETDDVDAVPMGLSGTPVSLVDDCCRHEPQAETKRVFTGETEGPQPHEEGRWKVLAEHVTSRERIHQPAARVAAAERSSLDKPPEELHTMKQKPFPINPEFQRWAVEWKQLDSEYG
ncbi:hypothetical protein BESB_053660 [Besnoitia besnoiti]|uniref:Uncharacterized protein n=1 Tax=Besnoitia besnoiti TaxID=94643 RepID=A0A2A9MCK2_BESBE|nr:hypothetical protein BESB_053660 [Besnoitia besnoiti]PFH35715.1 hypothetical protein BESB_053660 [Besnoitia besnoiti]